jgi:hypothetical protein
MMTENPAGDTGAVGESRSEPEIPAKAKRRTFTTVFKAKVHARYEAELQGAKSAALHRRHGVGSWHLSDWRRAREAGAADKPLVKAALETSATKPPISDVRIWNAVIRIRIPEEVSKWRT